jgi:hypothetical protein
MRDLLLDPGFEQQTQELKASVALNRSNAHKSEPNVQFGPGRSSSVQF